MKNKIILACAFFAILIAIGINSFAANNTTAQSLINSTINGTASAVNSTSNVINSGANATTNVVSSKSATTNGIKAASNSVTSSMNTMAGVTAVDAASATFLGISYVVWMWIMVIIIAIVIIMLVVKYVKERH